MFIIINDDIFHFRYLDDWSLEVFTQLIVEETLTSGKYISVPNFNFEYRYMYMKFK